MHVIYLIWTDCVSLRCSFYNGYDMADPHDLADGPYDLADDPYNLADDPYDMVDGS